MRKVILFKLRILWIRLKMLWYLLVSEWVKLRDTLKQRKFRGRLDRINRRLTRLVEEQQRVNDLVFRRSR